MSHDTHYGFMMKFFAPVIRADSKFISKGRNPVITLAKADRCAEYWPRLTKETGKNSRITVDWSRWIDEDEDMAPATPEPSMMNA